MGTSSMISVYFHVHIEKPLFHFERLLQVDQAHMSKSEKCKAVIINYLTSRHRFVEHTGTLLDYSYIKK